MSRVASLGYATVAVTLAAVAWTPVLRNFFHLDDLMHLQAIVNLPHLQWLLESTGGHLYPLRNLVFLLTHAAAGTFPVPYFATSLATHLLNVALLFALVVRATGSPRLACLGAVAWGTTPLNEGTIGWYSAYGHIISTTFLLVVLIQLVGRLGDDVVPRAPEVVRWYVLLLLASMSFGVAIGASLALGPAIVLACGVRRLPRSTVAALIAGPLAVVTCYAGVVRLYKWLYPTAPTLPITDLVVLTAHGFAEMLGMTAHLAIVGTTGIVAGFTHALVDYPTTAAYAVAAGTGLLFVVGLLLAPRPTRRLLVVALLLLVACYGMIALGRAALYEYHAARAHGAAQSRYHYTTMALVALALCTCLDVVGRRLRVARPLSDVLLAAWLVATIVLWRRSGWAIDHFDADRSAVAKVGRGIADAEAATPAGEPVFLRNGIFPPFPMPPPFFGGIAGIYTVWFARERPVYFIEPDPIARAVGAAGSRIRTAFVPPACGPIADVACAPPIGLRCDATPIPDGARSAAIARPAKRPPPRRLERRSRRRS